MYTAVFLVFLFVIFLPFPVSLFGRLIFVFITLVCCCVTLLSILFVLTSQPGHPGYLTVLFGSWLAAWLFAVAGIRSKRHHREIVRPTRAVRDLYRTLDRARATRGKNRALWPK